LGLKRVGSVDSAAAGRGYNAGMNGQWTWPFDGDHSWIDGVVLLDFLRQHREHFDHARADRHHR